MDVESDDASGSPMKSRGTIRRGVLGEPPLLEVELSKPNSTTMGQGAVTELGRRDTININRNGLTTTLGVLIYTIKRELRTAKWVETEWQEETLRRALLERVPGKPDKRRLQSVDSLTLSVEWRWCPFYNYL